MTQSPQQLLDALRAAPPLVQCITSDVAMNIAANVLLAAGASPAMVSDSEEAGEFACIAGALTVNIGTLSSPFMSGARAAIAVGNRWGAELRPQKIEVFRGNRTMLSKPRVQSCQNPPRRTAGKTWARGKSSRANHPASLMLSRGSGFRDSAMLPDTNRAVNQNFTILPEPSINSSI
jgi:hypothetical protein